MAKARGRFADLPPEELDTLIEEAAAAAAHQPQRQP